CVFLVCACVDAVFFFFFFSSRRRHTRFSRDWSSDVCSSDLAIPRRRRPRRSLGQSLRIFAAAFGRPRLHPVLVRRRRPPRRHRLRRRHRPAAGAMTRAGGYTLLELVVVVAVLAMATALVAPSGYRMIGTWREASQVDAALQSVASLPMLARREGHRLELGGEDAARDVPLIVGGRNDNTRMREEAEKASATAIALLALPEGWEVEFEPALVVQPNGAC